MTDRRGGYRPGSGRKKSLPADAKIHAIKCTPAEFVLIKKFVAKLREGLKCKS